MKKNEEPSSSGLTVPENIGTQVTSGDPLIGYVFDRRPVDGVQESFLVQPPRDELRADPLGFTSAVPAEEGGHRLRELRLAPRKFDGAAKRSNVISLHDRRMYKPACNMVNKSACMTADKGPCTVLSMPVVRKKSLVPKRVRKNPADFARGLDGRTANDRFREAFSTWRAPDQKTQSDLVRACNRIAGRPENPPKDYVSQQIIDQILRDEFDAARSQFLDVLAEALEVRAVWLRLGVGEKHPDRAVLDQVRQLLKAKS